MKNSFLSPSFKIIIIIKQKTETTTAGSNQNSNLLHYNDLQHPIFQPKNLLDRKAKREG